MPVNYQFRKGVDLPTWVWLTQCPVSALVSGAIIYDGSRYIYSWNSASLYRYDTWTNGWQFLATPGVGIAGQDLIYDPVRNVLLATTSSVAWQCFNLNNFNVTISAVVCAPWTLTTLTPVIPTAMATGAVLTAPKDMAAGAVVRSGTAGAAGQTVTNVASASAAFYTTLIGLTLEVTSGVQVGQKRTISAVVDNKNITLALALPGALADGDTFRITAPNGTASAGAVGTLTDAAQNWIVNKYSNWDVEILSGTGAGQRRRIASNTATVLTLAAVVAGNARTGNFGVAPDATSVYHIIPSTDFVYYGTGTTFWKLDIAANPAAVWTAIAAHPAGQLAGGGMSHSRTTAPGHFYAVRGGTSTLYTYDIGLNTWTLIPNNTWGLGPTEIFSTGASMVILKDLQKIVVLNEVTTQLFVLDLTTSMWDVCSNHPYIAGTGLEGKRIEEVITPEGVRFLYLLRAGGQEFWRIPIEWL